MTIHLFPDNTVFCNFAAICRVTLLRDYLNDRGRWTEAVEFEVSRSQSFLPDLEEVFSGGWMGEAITFEGEKDRREINGIRRAIFGGMESAPLQHLGESQTLHLIRTKYGSGEAQWLSDDRETIRYARGQQIVVKETQHLLGELVQAGALTDVAAFAMMEQMIASDRAVEIPGKAADFWKM